MPRPRSAPSTTPLAPAPRPKLADHVYERVLQGIAEGRYGQGGRLPSEQRLALAFGVSRPVVREALSRLRADGVVESRHGSGSYVGRRPHRDFLGLAPPGSAADLMRCFEFRIALEGEAAWLAASRKDDGDRAELTAALGALEAAIEGREVGTEADLRFHMAIARASKNKLFENALQMLATHVFAGMNVARRLSLRASRERLLLVQGEHRRIHAAILAEDAEGARAAMRAHIGNARTRALTDSLEP